MDIVTFECMCGKSLRVDKRLVGKMARCPGCGVTVRIPDSNGVALSPKTARPTPTAQAPQTSQATPSPAAVPQTQPQPTAVAPPPTSVKTAAPRKARSAIQPDRFPICELICGCLVLVTLILPWMVVNDRVAMSWDVLDDSPVSMLVTIILLWMIGAAAIVLSSLLRGKDASLWHGILGLAGIMLWLFQIPSGPSGPMRMSGLGASGIGVTLIFQFLFLMGMIVATNIRLRLPQQLTTRIVQGICSGGFLIFSFILFINLIQDYSQTSRFARSKSVGDFIFFLLLHIAYIASAILGIVHASAIRIKKDTLSQIALYLVYGAIGCLILYLIIRPAMAMEQPGFSLLILNFVFLTVPIMFLFCSGLIGFICHLASRANTAPTEAKATASSGGGVSVQIRLQKLGELKAQGLITDEEYSAKRTEILWEL